MASTKRSAPIDVDEEPKQARPSVTVEDAILYNDFGEDSDVFDEARLDELLRNNPVSSLPTSLFYTIFVRNASYGDPLALIVE